MWEDVKDQVINEMEASAMFFSGWFNRCYFLCSIACFHEIFIQETEEFLFVRDCKLQQLQIFWRCRQSCSVNMFVGFLLMELVQ